MLCTPCARVAAPWIAVLALIAAPSLASAEDFDCSDLDSPVNGRVNGNLMVDEDCEVSRAVINGNVIFDGPYDARIRNSYINGNVECDGVGTAELISTWVVGNVEDCDGPRNESDDDDGSETDDDGSETDDDGSGSGSDDDGSERDDDGSGSDDDGSERDDDDSEFDDDDDSEFDDDDGDKPGDDEDRAVLATGFVFCDEGKAAVFPATNVGMRSVEVVVACFDPAGDPSGFVPERGEFTIEPGQAQVVLKPACINPDVGGLGGELVRCTVKGDEDDVALVRGVLHICNAFEVDDRIEIEDCGVTAAQATEVESDDDDDDDDDRY